MDDEDRRSLGQGGGREKVPAPREGQNLANEKDLAGSLVRTWEKKGDRTQFRQAGEGSTPEKEGKTEGGAAPSRGSEHA